MRKPKLTARHLDADRIDHPLGVEVARLLISETRSRVDPTSAHVKLNDDITDAEERVYSFDSFVDPEDN